jgi:hypothetical protein
MIPFLQLFENEDCVAKPDDLKSALSQVGLAQDKNGFYIYTHRARSDSYPDPHDIPQEQIKFISSTG